MQERPHNKPRSPDYVTSEFITGLRSIVGDEDVLLSQDARAPYETDWTRHYCGTCAAVVRPVDAAQVSSVLELCTREGVSVVPQGGNTGLVGGATPRGRHPQIVLSSRRMAAIEDIDASTGQITLGAGVTLAELQRTARKAGLEAGLDLGARDAATIGGLAACDAGGLQTLRYGTARRRVVGAEFVLADGTVVTRLGGLLKDNAGYNLPAVLIGSEGTLGFFTRLRWSCVSPTPARATAVVALDSIDDAVRIASGLRRALPSLELLELITDAGLRLLRDRMSIALPLPVSSAWVLVGCAASSDPTDAMLEALSALGAEERTACAVDAGGQRRLLHLRESLPDAISQEPVASHKLDVGVPLGCLAAFCTRLRDVVRRHARDARLILFGHLGDGNLHINILGPPVGDKALDAAVLGLVARFGGTISAEHGVGSMKPSFLSLVRAPAELRVMRLIKGTFDPSGIMNPDVVLETV